MSEGIKKLPLFILAGVDANDSFGKKRLFDLEFRNKKIPEYLINEARKSGCFSEIYLIGEKGLEKEISRHCSFIKASKSLWKNIKIIFDLTKNKYHHSTGQIAILLSDILPSSQDLREVFLKCQCFFEKDFILLVVPSGSLRKKRGMCFFKKDENSSAEPYAGSGGFYILRPPHLNERLIYSLISLRLPREVRKIEVIDKKIYFEALRSFTGIIFFIYLIFKIFLYALFFIDKIIFFIKIFLKHQKRELTFQEAERFLSKVFVKRKYQQKDIASVHIEIVDSQVFVEDIDSEDDLEILKIKKPQ